MQGDARRRGTRTPTVTLSTIGYRPSAIDYRLSAIDYRLSAIAYRLSIIAYRLSAIDYRLSAIECKTRLHRPDRIPTPAHGAPVPPNRDDAGASSHSGTRPC